MHPQDTQYLIFQNEISQLLYLRVQDTILQIRLHIIYLRLSTQYIII